MRLWATGNGWYATNTGTTPEYMRSPTEGPCARARVRAAAVQGGASHMCSRMDGRRSVCVKREMHQQHASEFLLRSLR